MSFSKSFLEKNLFKNKPDKNPEGFFTGSKTSNTSINEMCNWCGKNKFPIGNGGTCDYCNFHISREVACSGGGNNQTHLCASCNDMFRTVIISRTELHCDDCKIYMPTCKNCPGKYINEHDEYCNDCYKNMVGEIKWLKSKLNNQI